jgi:hypothetical protein
MWKRALWVYVVLCIVGLVGLIVYDVVRDVRSGEFVPVALILPLVLFIPPGALAFELRGKKVPVVITLFALLITAVPLVGMFNFDGFTLATIGKGLLFVPMLAGLGYFAYRRLFKK